MFFYCLFIEVDGGDRPLRSTKKYSRRRHRREECLIIENIMAEQLQFREQLIQQQLEMNKLKEAIEKCRDLSKKIDDEIEQVVHGVCDIQDHLEQIESKRIAEINRRDQSIS